MQIIQRFSDAKLISGRTINHWLAGQQVANRLPRNCLRRKNAVDYGQNGCIYQQFNSSKIRTNNKEILGLK